MFRYLLLLFCFIYSSNLNSQTGKVVYKKEMNLLFIKEGDKSKEAVQYKKFANRINSDLENVEYSLIFNDTTSLFKRNNSLKLDNKSINFAAGFGGGKGVYYTNNKTGLALQQADAFGELFLIQSHLNDFEWELTKEEKIINDKRCYKAILKNDKNPNRKFDTFAWFCPEIPSHFGPIGYGNLPGLIMELHLNKGYSFYAIKIILNEGDTKIKQPTKGIKVTSEELEEIGKELIDKKRKG